MIIIFIISRGIEMDDSNKNYTTATLLLFSFMGIVPLGAQAEEINQLETINVSATVESKTLAGKDEVYSKNNVTEYKSKKEIETYHSQSVSDLLSGITGVYSGDARNGGAIDPIIRSSWGQGRIPVLVDDTEQAITIWRGYSGVSNRNYLDPFLVSEVNVEKGPNLDRTLRSGAAGTIRMSTLNPDEIIKPGKKWGIELKTETANNSIKARPYEGVPIGQDYRLVSPDGRAELAEWALYFKDDDRISPRKKGRNKPLHDNAIRLALAAKDDGYEVLGAYAYRNKGNYFAGKRGGKKYGEGTTGPLDLDKNSDDPYIPLIARIYKPGEEVPNTSYESRSWLLKGKLHFNKHTSLSANFRDTKINYGDIMPSRLGYNYAARNTVTQWPLADVKQKTGNVEFSYNPPDNKWLDLKIGVWAVKNDTATNTSGGSPGDVLFSDYNTQMIGTLSQFDLANEFGDKAYELDQVKDPVEYKRIKDRFYEIFNSKIKEYMKKPQFDNIDGIFNTQPAQVQFARDNHMGITFSNSMELTPKLRLSVMTNYRRETLDSTNVYELWDKYQLTAFNQYETDAKTEGENYTCVEGDIHGICRVSNSARSGNRKGNRNEFNAGFKFEYSPTDWLLLTAGMKYTHYKSKDRGLQEKIANLKQEEVLTESRIPFTVRKLKQVAPEITQDYINFERKNNLRVSLEAEFKKLYPIPADDSPELQKWLDDRDEYVVSHGWTPTTDEEYDSWSQLSGNNSQWDESATQTIYWERDEYGNFSVEHFPLTDGRITKEMLEKKVIHPQTGKEDYLYDISADFSGSPEKTPITKEQWEKMKKAERKDHAWAPSFSATAFLSDNARIYVRYDETKRMPSIFEDTIGYSIDILTPLYKRKPEHSKNIEVGYVHDLRGFFPSLRRADIRLNWYKNTTKNIFDRDINYEMKQFDKRILEGIELSARYDQGRIFGDIGISYNIKNKFCDKSSAIRDVGRIGDIHTFEAYPECVNGGNENGYLKNAILPKYSITSNLGVRFLDERLEVGTRMVYHTNVKETRNKSLRDAGWFANSNNNPRWQPVFLVDAYMNYKVNENLALSLSATNLTDRYYLDPMTRSSMPAPGRTIKLGLTATF